MRTTAMMIEALIELRQKQDGLGHEHFWQMAERFRADLINQAMTVLGNQADAEDIVQDSLAKAFLDLGKLRDPQKLGIWLRKINRCNALDLLRRKKAQREERLVTAEAVALTKTRLPRRKRTPDAGWETVSEEERVMRAVDELPKVYREVVVLHYWEKMTLAQVARCLGVPAGTVRSRIARADEILLKKFNRLSRREEHPA